MQFNQHTYAKVVVASDCGPSVQYIYIHHKFTNFIAKNERIHSHEIHTKQTNKSSSIIPITDAVSTTPPLTVQPFISTINRQTHKKREISHSFHHKAHIMMRIMMMLKGKWMNAMIINGDEDENDIVHTDN